MSINGMKKIVFTIKNQENLQYYPIDIEQLSGVIIFPTPG
jgi:hypothetical protein